MKKVMGILMSGVLVATMAVCVPGCSDTSGSSGDSGSSSSSSTSNSSSSSTTSEAVDYIDSVDEDDEYATGVHHVKVTVEGYDAFTIAIDSDNAPITASNFCHLVESGFYNGLTFHRAVSRFCLQGGDPEGNGTGGSDDKIKGEFSGNDVANTLADNYDRGVVAMARSSNANSASSQFFITLSSDYASSLNGLYAAFGTIGTKGMNIVDQIVEDCIDSADISTGAISKKSKQPVIKKMTIVD